jgi:RNA polymerase sigma factor (sigma-70 family)
MFVNDLFKLIENSNEEYYAVYNQRGKPMIMRKPAGKTAQAYAEEKNLTIKGGPFDSHNETESFWIRSVLPAKKEQGMAEDSNQSNPDAKKNVKSAEEIIRALRPDLPPDWKYKPPADQESKPAADNRKERLRKDITAVDYNKEQQPLAAPSAEQKADIRRAVSDYNKEKQVKEAGPFSYGARKPRKGSVADLAAKKRQEQERGQQPIEPKNQRVGTAKVVKEFLDDRNKDDDDGGDGRGRKSPKARARAQVLKMYGDGDITFRKTSNGGYFIQHEDDVGDTHSHQYDPQTGRVDFSSVTRSSYYGEGVAEGGFDIPEIPRAPQPRPEPKNKTVGEGSVQDKLHRRHQELRKKRGAPDPEYYQELKKTYDMPDDERWARTAELKKKYKVSEAHPNQQISRYNFDGETYRGEKMPSIDKDDILQRGQQVDYQPIYGTEPYSSLFDKDANDNDDPADQQSLTKILNQYLNQLPARFRQILTLRFYKGQTLEEIAQQFGLTAARIREIEAKALRMLAHKAKQDNLKAYLPAGRAVKNETTNYKITNEDRERYVEELERAGYEIVTEAATLCPECGGAAYADQMLAEKQDACYHKVKSRYKVWPSAYASGALVRCRKKGAANWGNKSKK